MDKAAVEHLVLHFQVSLLSERKSAHSSCIVDCGAEADGFQQ